MEVKEFNLKKIYSEASGVTAYLEPKIEIKMNKRGEYEEVVNAPDDCLLNPLVEKVSPHLNDDIDEGFISSGLYGKVDGMKFDKRIGYYKSLFVGHVTEGDYREKASSGGVGTWIFKELLEAGLIDGVIHVKKNEDKNSSILFKYEISKTVEEIKKGAKTKYYPVELSEVLELVRNNNGKYAVIGIPSFIKAVRLLALQDKVINERIILTVGLVCGHQKSTKFADFMAWQVGIEPGNLKEIDFRHKLADQRADSYGVKMVGEVKGKLETIIIHTHKLKGQNWGLGYFKALASDFTDDVFNETADIVIGDAWLPEYAHDSEGNNVIIARNPIIAELLNVAISDGRLEVDEVNAQGIFDSQSSHYKHTHDELGYRMFKESQKKNWYPKNRVKKSKKIPFLRGKVQDVRTEISRTSHLLYQEAVEKDDLNGFIKKMDALAEKYELLYRLMRVQKNGFSGAVKKVIGKVKR